MEGEGDAGGQKDGQSWDWLSRADVLKQWAFPGRKATEQGREGSVVGNSLLRRLVDGERDADMEGSVVVRGREVAGDGLGEGGARVGRWVVGEADCAAVVVGGMVVVIGGVVVVGDGHERVVGCLVSVPSPDVEALVDPRT